eukprot:NODE_5575_length_995_cov_44.574541_g5000_i0.p1 GENE.NODE_5575_length_995_cov_44.574541_g5000_i0~~NODE_5575_length_995_cov_44.574541_g5000_i0.p1  ORF type:complete len:139 (+),score=14.57 NODE_5575_length_995_cov_44.574541_g5000_i0:233-649(+)
MGKRFREYGVDIRLNPGSKVANTVNAHRLLHYTLENHGSTKQNEVQEVLFRKYFNEGRNLGDIKELEDSAQECGILTPELSQYLSSDKDKDLILQQDREGKMKGISGVPYFEIEGYPQGLSGAQTPDTFKQIFSRLKR